MKQQIKQQMQQCGLLSRFMAVAILCFSFAFFQASPILAADDIDDDPASPSVDADVDPDNDSDEDVTSNFKNPAQAAHASQLADAVAGLGSKESEEASADVEAAKEGLEVAMKADDLVAIEKAQEELEAAEKAYADVVSELTGVVSEDLTDMRAAGMGWGNIAHELGVHPSVLGLGHTKQKQKNTAEMFAGSIAGSIEASEVEEATARNTRSGYAQGHGLGMNTGVDTQNSGLGFGKASKSRGKGLGGAAGLGSGDVSGTSSSSGPGNSGNSNKGGAGVAGKDGSPGGGNSGNSNSQGGGKDKGSKGNNGKSGDKGNSKK